MNKILFSTCAVISVLTSIWGSTLKQTLQITKVKFITLFFFFIVQHIKHIQHIYFISYNMDV